MIRTSLIAAASGSSRPSTGITPPVASPALAAGLSRGGPACFSRILAEVLMNRMERPQTVRGTRQEFPQPARMLGDSRLSQMMMRSSLGRSSASIPSRTRPSSGSEPERLFNSVKYRGQSVDPKVYEGLIKEAAARHQVPEELVKAVIKVESNFNPQATSHMGAMGLMQLMPGTARDLGVQRPYDPKENINGGTKYLRELLDRYDGNVPRAVAAYNCGMANVEKGILPQETRSYLQLVSKYYQGSQVLPKGRIVPPVLKSTAPNLTPLEMPAPDLDTTTT